MASARRKKYGVAVSAIALSMGMALLAAPVLVIGASHREAPGTSGDPKADGTDLYAFVSPDKPDSVTLIANYLPFEEPAGGPTFYQFDPSVLYEIKVDSDGNAEPDVSYQFRFKTNVANPATSLFTTGAVDSLTDPELSIQQTYTLTKVKDGQSTVLGDNIPVGPSNVGPKSTPAYENLQGMAVKDVGAGTKAFAGQSEDPFFVELGGLFDLLTIRQLPGNAGGGVDGLKGYNVQSLALQVPISELSENGSRPTDTADPNSVVGVWTTSSRQATQVLNPDGGATQSGEMVQVSRLGAPLVNEVVIPLSDKDRWNRSKPTEDAQFANYVTNPELGGLLKSIYNVNVPPQGQFGTPEQRDDLVAIFLTGVPGLTKPANVVPSEQLRLNVAVPPTANPNPLGVLGGDNQGYPNGRRLADDVTDISIRAVAGAAYPLFHPDFTPDPLASQLGDGVPANDKPFRNAFPYLALPYSGFESVPHANASTGNPTPPPAPNQPASITEAQTEYQAALDRAKVAFDKGVQEAMAAQAGASDANRGKKEFDNRFNKARTEYIKALGDASKQLNERLKRVRT